MGCTFSRPMACPTPKSPPQRGPPQYHIVSSPFLIVGPKTLWPVTWLLLDYFIVVCGLFCTNSLYAVFFKGQWKPERAPPGRLSRFHCFGDFVTIAGGASARTVISSKVG
eukprot:RCo007331